MNNKKGLEKSKLKDGSELNKGREKLDSKIQRRIKLLKGGDQRE